MNDKRTQRPLVLSDTEKYNIYTAQKNTKNVFYGPPCILHLTTVYRQWTYLRIGYASHRPSAHIHCTGGDCLSIHNIALYMHWGRGLQWSVNNQLSRLLPISQSARAVRVRLSVIGLLHTFARWQSEGQRTRCWPDTKVPDDRRSIIQSISIIGLLTGVLSCAIK